MDHAKTLYDKAVDLGLTSAQVAEKTRKQMAAACGVDLATAEPASFLAWNIKRQVVRRLKADEAAAVSESRREKVLAAVKAIVGEHNATAEFVKAGDTVEGPCIVIRKGE